MKNITPADGDGAKAAVFLKLFLWSAVFCLALRLSFCAPPPKPGKAPPAQAVSSEAPRVPVEFSAPRVKGNWNAGGVRLDDLELKDYFDKSGAPVRLYSHGKEAPSYAEFGYLSDAGEMPGAATEWNVESRGDASVVLSWKNSRGVGFKRSMAFDRGYVLSVRDTVSNFSPSDITIYPYARVVGSADPGKAASSHTGFVGVLDGKLIEETYADIAKEPKLYARAAGWFGFSGQYFLSALLNAAESRVSVQEISPGVFQADFVRDAV
ncbi:MAG: membrane protein insertase YidC, partial [Rickettsiales bacterium]|nr:membrane protein insertase YidC [Rickettsiales bacterium]